MNNHNTLKKPISGIILSGGLSNRFQQVGQSWQDKALLTIINNESILKRTIKILAEICNEIIIITNNQIQQLIYEKEIEKFPDEIKSIIQIKIDNQNILCSGPSRGVISAINYINNQYVIVTPIDTPFINSKIFIDLLNNLKDSSICVPLWPSGKIEPLIFAFDFIKLTFTLPLLAFNERSRADDLFRLCSSINFLPLKASELAKQIFKSINNRHEYNQIKKDLSINEISLFNINEIISIKENENPELNIITYNFFKKTNFRKINNNILEEGLLLSQNLSKNNLFYQAGFLLMFLLLSINHSNVELRPKLYSQMCKMCIECFEIEAKKWEEINIKFLALHAYSDAYFVANLLKLNERNKLKAKITDLRKHLELREKEHKDISFESLVIEKLPTFLEKAKKLIHDTEVAFNEKEPTFETDFLWDHSYRVGKIAYYLAIQEGVDPFIPTVAAILHDAGKFVLGEYHKDDITEESHSSLFAGKLLEEEGLSKKEIIDVQNAILGLYDEKIFCSKNCQIVHDADRLDKLGILGIANFFTKMTLRGSNLSENIVRNLSRELTYTFTAPITMLTKTGQLIASSRKNQTLNYFYELLEELHFYGLGKYYIKDFDLNNGNQILLVVPENCFNCQGKYVIDLDTKSGLKCEKLIARYQCTDCGDNYLVEFCLPLITQDIID